jgi:hypothetical protein
MLRQVQAVPDVIDVVLSKIETLRGHLGDLIVRNSALGRIWSARDDCLPMLIEVPLWVAFIGTIYGPVCPRVMKGAEHVWVGIVLIMVGLVMVLILVVLRTGIVVLGLKIVGLFVFL